MKYYAYIRVSTNLQNHENQRFEIETYASRQGIKIDDWIEETISSRKPLEKRKLGKLLDSLQQDDVLIATEISRLGRNMLEVMGILQNCLERGCQVITLKENYHLGTDIQSKVLAFAFSLAGEIERQLISQRITETMKRLKHDGKHLGRPFGFSYKKLRRKHAKIMELLSRGISKAEIARLMGCSWQTLHRYLKDCPEFV